MLDIVFRMTPQGQLEVIDDNLHRIRNCIREIKMWIADKSL